MEPETEQKISTFCALTGSSRDKAAFYLESSNGSVEGAVSYYFDNEAQSGTEHDESHLVANDASHEAAYDNSSHVLGAEVDAASVRSQNRQVLPEASKRGSSARNQRESRIKSFSDLNAENSPEDDEDERNEYYTGGEKSGMMVQDPNRRKKPIAVDDIFEQAREHGAQQGQLEDLEPKKAKSGTFAGKSFTLSGQSDKAAEEPSEPAPSNGPQKHTIVFWTNGFTVDDGPLRRLDDPANARFLNSISRGELPSELSHSDPRVFVDVSLVKKAEEWKAPPEPKYRAFAGSSNTLGAPGPSQVPSAIPGAVEEEQSGSIPVVDEAQPVTSVQVRLRDGSRLVLRLNHTHTVADLRALLEASRPQASGNYSLQTGFPPKTLSELSATLEEAKLLNAVVLQR